MDASAIAAYRLHNQQVSNSKFNSAGELVAYMGVVQAQDFASSLWAVGCRLAEGNEQTVRDALDAGEVLRTHLLRPTWHLVSKDDIYWLLSLCADSLISLLKGRHKELGISQDMIRKSRKMLERELRDHRHQSRDMLQLVMKKEIAGVESSQFYHLMFLAELEGIVCSGRTEKNKSTCALLEERVPLKKVLAREEALVTLAERYFISHGPATLADFVWWSGLPVKDARKGLEGAKSKLLSERSLNGEHWFSDTIIQPPSVREHVHFLPAFDEYLISYKDRSAVMQEVHRPRAISFNGIFRPVMVVNGQVKGIWKRTEKKDGIMIEAELFNFSQDIRDESLREVLEKYGNFKGKKVNVIMRSIQ